MGFDSKPSNFNGMSLQQFAQLAQFSKLLHHDSSERESTSLQEAGRVSGNHTEPTDHGTSGAMSGGV